MDRYDADVVVVGAGVIGLAVARALALAGREVVVVEREAHIGEHQSSRNSEVIHAGLYYKPQSLKAKFCVEGRRLIYEYCIARSIPHRQIGKLLVATSANQGEGLMAIKANAEACGVSDLALLSGAEAVRLEPSLRAELALFSPCSGIIDSHSYLLSLVGDMEAAGGSLALGSTLTHITPTHNGLEVCVRDGGGETILTARTVVNCAGLFAVDLALACAKIKSEAVPQAGFARGCYFSLAGRAPFERLIYPLPEPGGLGVHLTLDLAGQARFGPDVEWIDHLDYSVDPRRADGFYAEIRKYWPGLLDGSLSPAYAGVRAKIGPRETIQDFSIATSREHGIEGLICLFGFESPGLTSSLSIANTVAKLV